MNRSFLFLLFAHAGLLVNAQSVLQRQHDPVIVTGASLPGLSGLNPSEIVGFRYDNQAWTQIPVQVDERALLDIVKPYGPLAGTGVGYLPPAPSANNPKIYFYCDANTHVGPDPVVTFDSDDELVFMAKDAGNIFTGSTYPAGVLGTSCHQVMINDTMHKDTAYVYLFKQDGTLQQNGGSNYVSYTSNLATTSGFPANNNMTNTENTTISTSRYSWHFISEWVSDELKITAGTGTDILDRHKAFFANGTPGCGRHEELFSSGENAFVACKTGPVRIIRSYMGAQSGPVTQRTHFFYNGRHDIITNLRVHYIPSIYDAFDYNPNASGMIYRNEFNTVGVTIDGTADVVAVGNSKWEQVSGVPGTLSIVNRVVTDLSAGNATFTGYYDDNSTNPASNCTGTQGAWGTSGVGVLFANNICTDCYTSTNFHSLEMRKTLYTDPSSLASSIAILYSEQIDKPFQLTFSSCQISTGLSDEQQKNEIACFPNPSAGSISIKGLEHEGNKSVSIFNMYGQLVDMIQLNTGENSFFISKPGIYEVIITAGNTRVTKKIAIDR